MSHAGPRSEQIEARRGDVSMERYSDEKQRRDATLAQRLAASQRGPLGAAARPPVPAAQGPRAGGCRRRGAVNPASAVAERPHAGTAASRLLADTLLSIGFVVAPSSRPTGASNAAMRATEMGSYSRATGATRCRSGMPCALRAPSQFRGRSRPSSTSPESPFPRWSCLSSHPEETT